MRILESIRLKIYLRTCKDLQSSWWLRSRRRETDPWRKETIETEVDRNNWRLLSFVNRAGSSFNRIIFGNISICQHLRTLILKTRWRLTYPKVQSIAVLPFDNMTGDPEEEFFCDGFTENIISSLSQTPKLLVIARNSTFVLRVLR